MSTERKGAMKARNDYICFDRQEDVGNGVSCVVLRLRDYDDLANVPSVIEYEGRLHGKTGWNSDRMEVYFRTDANMVRVVA